MNRNSCVLAFIAQIKGILCELIPEGSPFHLCEVPSAAQPITSSLSGGTEIFGLKHN